MTESNITPLCAHCLKGYELPGEPTGTEEKIGPFNTYVAQPTSAAKSDTALVFFTDVFGLGLVNNKIVPDKFAEQLGIPVFVPDLFDSKPINPSFGDALPSTAAEAKSQGLISKVRMIGKIVTVGPWFISNTPKSKYARIEQFLKVLREEKGYKKLGAIGYCYGGNPTLYFNKEFEASVAAHPSLWQIDWIEKITKPVAFSFCEVDPQVSDAQREQIVAILDKKKGTVDSETKFYEGTTHGNFIRPNFADPKVKAAFEEAYAQAAAFFKKHLLDGSAPAATSEAVAQEAAVSSAPTSNL